MPGVCRLGDRAKAPLDSHGCVKCPHVDVVGPAISASSNVFVNGSPALRIHDIGMHTACCGTQMWKVIAASGTVFVNGSAMVRKGDTTAHCGGIGKMIDASANVVDGSPMLMASPFNGVPPLPPLPDGEVMVYPSEEPGCVSPTNRGGAVQAPGLPTSGDPQIYNERSAEAALAARLPHASAGPTEDQKAASERVAAARAWLANDKEGYEEHAEKAHEHRHDALREQLSLVQDGLKEHFETKEKAEEQIRNIENAMKDNEREGAAELQLDPEIEEGMEGL